MGKSISCVYWIENIVNNKKYVGSTTNYKRRCIKHKSELKNGYHHNENLQKDYDLYGKNAFKFKILERYSDESMLRMREQAYIDELILSGEAYNISELSTSPCLPGEKNPMYGEEGYWKGKKMPEKARRNMSAGAKGKKISKETRRKMSEARKGKFVGEKNPMYGIKLTEAQKEHLSKMNLGELNPFYGKKHSDKAKEKMSLVHKESKRIYGANNPKAKLTKEQAIEIYFLVEGKTRREWPDLSAYNVSESTIYSIKKKEHWAIRQHFNMK